MATADESEAQKDLEQRCDDLWAKLCEIQEQMSDLPAVAVSSPADSLVVILREKERQIKAQIDLLAAKQNNTSDLLNRESPVLLALLREEMTNDVAQLQQTLLALRAQRETILCDIKTQKEVQGRLTELRNSLDDKVANTENTPTEDSQSLENLTRRNSTLDTLYKMRLKQMASFIRQHFPSLTDDQVKKWYKKHGSSEKKPLPASSLLTMQAILEQLMNKCLQQPHDPYITMDDTFWPPYIELLLQCEIALRHPTDCNRIRLTAYHH